MANFGEKWLQFFIIIVQPTDHKSVAHVLAQERSGLIVNYILYLISVSCLVVSNSLDSLYTPEGILETIHH